MNQKIKRHFLLTVVIGVLLLALVPLTSINSRAADQIKTFIVPLTYTNTAGKNVSVNLMIKYTTESLTKGTVITVSGLPTDSISTGANINCGFVEINSKTGDIMTYQLFGGTNGTAYSNGTITYTMQNSNAGAALTIGANKNREGNPSDGYYLLDESGIIGDLYTGKIINGTATSSTTTSNDSSDLANASINNAEFNAKVYYDNNPDLQTAIGADAQALYNHWVNYGKAEGRKAK